ncbi:methyl-accepting chemotaxis protein [Kordiimonas marina]|uniref:methyl-accepting chemotaxis protein n=1 Tax=Kordiimonas marina TaxID=2872312 RepID=UPI001FF60B6E|nr:methyl-accepting chemotaxis protein [Kordiimonas marina]MCJ9428343.1 CZB domain-containing protein [Kordiimonas marina]
MTERSDVEGLIDLLIEGRFDDVPEGHDPLTQKIKSLAITSQKRAISSLARTVDMAVTTTSSVTSVAEMVREIKEVDSQSQTIAAAVEELAASVNSIAESAEGVADEVGHVAESAARGTEAAAGAERTMEEIADAVEGAAKKVDSLSAASEQIGAIVKEIEDIAKQTNLLALNATIEAARAGEAGKGFAVVAGEVKSLANQTAKATEVIRERINHLRSDMAAIVTSMHEGGERVARGRDIIHTSGEEIRQISAQVDNVILRVQEVSATLTQQTQASQEVSEGVAVIAEMCTKNVASVEEVITMLEGSEQTAVDAMPPLMDRAGKVATVYAAKSDHMVWMRKLSQMLAGRAQLNADELLDHHGCRLGKWYDTQKDPAFTALPEWHALQDPHRHVHAAGIEAVRCYNMGDLSGAIECVHEACEASKEVMRLLDDIADKALAGGSARQEHAA